MTDSSDAARDIDPPAPPAARAPRRAAPAFGRELRLRKREEFQRVFQQRVSVADDVLIAYGAFNQLGVTRLGLAVSRKVGKATVRNRWKRLLREAFRLTHGRLPTGLDVVLLPRPPGRPQLGRLQAALPHLLRRLEKRLKQRGASP